MPWYDKEFLGAADDQDLGAAAARVSNRVRDQRTALEAPDQPSSLPDFSGLVGRLKDMWNGGVEDTPSVGVPEQPTQTRSVTPERDAQTYAAPTAAPSPAAAPADEGTGFQSLVSTLQRSWAPPAEAEPTVRRPGAATATPAALPQDGGTRVAPTVARPGAASSQNETLGQIEEGNPERFFATAGPYARQVERETGIPAALSLAIAANETGYGQRRYMAGSNNFHGIQARAGEAGAVPYKDWRPGAGGGQVFYDAAQRSFADPLAGFHGFASFLRDNPRYAPALAAYRQTGDVNALAAGIHQAGYAEDPAYTTKITSIMRGIPTPTGVGEVTAAPGVAPRQVGLTSGPPPVQRQQRAEAPTPGLDVGGITQAYAGVPYTFGGPGGRGQGVGATTDCSGFVSAVWKQQYGLDLPAHTDAAYNQLQAIGGQKVSEKDAAPGDVVFYMGAGTGGAVTHHMGIYAGPGQVLDMSVSGGSGVKTRSLGHGGTYVILRDPRVGGRPTAQSAAPPARGELAAAPPVVRPVGVAEASGGRRPSARQIDQWSEQPVAPDGDPTADSAAAPSAAGSAPRSLSAQMLADPTILRQSLGQTDEPLPEAPAAPARAPARDDWRTSSAEPVFDPDQGPREALPGSVGADPRASTPPPVYGPPLEEAGPPLEEPPPPVRRPQYTGPSYSQPRLPEPPPTYGPPLSEAGPPLEEPAPPRPQYQGPSYSQPRLPEGARQNAPITPTERAEFAQGIEAATSAPAVEQIGPVPIHPSIQRGVGSVLGALQAVNTAAEATFSRVDPVWQPILAMSGIIETEFDPATRARYRQLAEKGQVLPGLTAAERDEFSALTAQGWSRYEQIKNDPDQITKYANVAPEKLATSIVLGLGTALLGAGAGGAVTRVATAAGAPVRAARAAGYAADVGLQTAADPSNALQLPIDAAVQGVGAVRRLSRGAGARGAEQAARRTESIIPPDVVDTFDYPIRIPDDPRVVRALEGVGATIDPDRGVTMGVIRAQGPKAAGQTATRGGVFYEAIPEGGISRYKRQADDPRSVGGTQVIGREKTTFRSPLFISDAPGSKPGFDDAMRQMPDPNREPAREAFQDALRAHQEAVARRTQNSATPAEVAQARSRLIAAHQALVAAKRPVTFETVTARLMEAAEASPPGSPAQAAALKAVISEYGGDPDVIDDLLALGGFQSGETMLALRENILSAAARRNGHDGVITLKDDLYADEDILELAEQHPRYLAQQERVAQLDARLRATPPGTPAWDHARADWEDEAGRLASLLDDLMESGEVRPPPRVSEIIDPRENLNPTPGAAGGPSGYSVREDIPRRTESALPEDETALATRPRAAQGEVIPPPTDDVARAWALSRQVESLQRLVDDLPPGAPDRQAQTVRLNEAKNELDLFTEDLDNQISEARAAVYEADRAWSDGSARGRGQDYDEIVGEPLAELDHLEAQRAQWPPAPPSRRQWGQEAQPPAGRVESAMPDELPPPTGQTTPRSNLQAVPDRAPGAEQRIRLSRARLGPPVPGAGAVRRVAQLRREGAPDSSIKKYQSLANAYVNSPEELAERLRTVPTVTAAEAREMLGERPEYLQPVVRFLLEQRQKALRGDLTARDVAKAYYMTLMSMRSSANDMRTIQDKVGRGFRTGAGEDIPPQPQLANLDGMTDVHTGRPLGEIFTEANPRHGGREVRPESMGAAWLWTDDAQRALNGMDEGEFVADAWERGRHARLAFGSDTVGNNGALRPLTEAEVRRGMVNMTNLPDFVKELNAGILERGNAGRTAEIGPWLTDQAKRLNGIGVGKSAFIKQLLGFGDAVTIDAREINYWLSGRGLLRTGDTSHGAELARASSQWWDNRTVSGALQPRIQQEVANLRSAYPELTAGIPDEDAAHILHHWIWDKSGGSETRHTDVMKSQRDAASPAAGVARKNVAETAAALTVPGRQAATAVPGAVAGGVAGNAATDEDATWTERLRNITAGAVTGGIAGPEAVGRGTLAAARLVDGMVASGKLPASILSGHPDVPERVRALFALAAHGVADDAVVEVPGMAQMLSRMRPRQAEQVAELMQGGLTASEIRQIVGRQTTVEKLGKAASELAVDAVTGLRNMQQRARETTADRATILGRSALGRLPEVAPRGPGAPPTIEAWGGRAHRVTDPSVTDLVNSVADELGMPRPNVYVSEAPVVNAQVAHGGGRTPDLMLGRGLFGAGMEEAEIRALLTHEMAHVGDADTGRSLLGQAATAVREAFAPSGRAAGQVAPTGSTASSPGRATEAVVEQPANYREGTPEAAVEKAMRAAAAASPDKLSHMTGEQIMAIEGAPFSIGQSKGKGPLSPGGLPGMDDMRAAETAGIAHKDFYTEIGKRAAEVVGEDNLPEFYTIAAITSAQTKVEDNVGAVFTIMRWMREQTAAGRYWAEMKKEFLDGGDKIQPIDKKTGQPKVVMSGPNKGKPVEIYTRRPPVMWTLATGEKRRAIIEAYETGLTSVKKGAKTSSFGGNFESAGQAVYDPRATLDLWAWRAFNVMPGKEGTAGGQDDTYRFGEAIYNELAREKGIQAHQSQAAVWATMKNLLEQAPDLVKEFRAGNKSLAQIVEDGAKRTVTVKGQTYNLFDVPTGQGGVFDLAPAKRSVAGAAPGIMQGPGPMKAASMTREYKGVGPNPLPSSGTARAAARTVEEARAPIVAAPLTPEQLAELELDPRTGTFPWLTVPHRVAQTTDGALVHLPGGNSDSAAHVAQIAADRAGSATVHAPMSAADTPLGVAVTADPAQITTLAAELDAAGIRYAPGTTGRTLQVPDLDDDPEHLLGILQGAAERAGVAPDSVTVYTGEVRHAQQMDPRAAGEVRDIYGSPRPRGLSDGTDGAGGAPAPRSGATPGRPASGAGDTSRGPSSSGFAANGLTAAASAGAATLGSAAAASADDGSGGPGSGSAAVGLGAGAATLAAALLLKKYPKMARVQAATAARQARIAASPDGQISALAWNRKLVGTIGYSSMIGPATAAVNLFGNAMETAWSIPKEATRAVVRGNPREAAAMAAGAVRGMGEWGTAVKDALAARGAYAPNPDNPLLSEQTSGALSHLLVSGLEVGGRVFTSLPDAIFGTVARSAGEAREAAQLATEQMKNLGIRDKKKWQSYVDTYLNEAERARKAGSTQGISPEVQQVITAGEEYAKGQTFRRELGTIGKGASKLAGRDIPVVGSMLTPFFNTPWNMGQALLERSPAGALMNRQTGFDKKYDAIAGSALLMGTALGPGAAGMITGSGPADPEKRKMMEADGWKPYHTLIGGTYYPNRVFGVYGKFLNMVGDVHDGFAYKKKDATLQDAVADGLPRFGRLLKEEPYLQGLAEILGAIDERGAGGAERYISSLGTRLVPYGATARAVGTALDPVERDPGKTKDFLGNIGERVRAGVGLRGDLPVAQDVLGAPKANPQQGLAAIGPKTSSGGPSADVVQPFLDHGVDIGPPKKEISEDGVTVVLTQPEVARWNALRGEALAAAARRETALGVLDRVSAARAAERLEDIKTAAAEKATAALKREVGAAAWLKRRQTARQTKVAS